MEQACQRVREAKKAGGGMHYCFEIYVPKTSGFNSDYKLEKDQLKIEAVRECRRFTEDRLKQFNAVVRCYYV